MYIKKSHCSFSLLIVWIEKEREREESVYDHFKVTTNYYKTLVQYAPLFLRRQGSLIISYKTSYRNHKF